MDKQKNFYKPQKENPPRLTVDEVYEELEKRTHVAKSKIKQIFRAYISMIEQCVENKVEIPLGKIGYFGFILIPPKDLEEWNSFYARQRVVFWKEKADGFLKPTFRFHTSFHKKMYDRTLIPYGSMPSIAAKIHFRPHSKIYLSFEEIKAKALMKRLKAIEEDEFNDDIEREEDVCLPID